MQDSVTQFGQALAEAAIARDWPRVHGMLAPWLRARQDVDAVRAFFEDDYRKLAGSDIDELHYPQVPYVSGNSSSLDFLREKPSFRPAPRPIPAEVTAANFRQWMNVQLQCSQDQQEELEIDFLTDVWLVVVEIGEGLRVGYWSHDAY